MRFRRGLPRQHDQRPRPSRLGSLIEKEITTPEYYPLSLSALLNACNQKSNREPVMTLDEAAVRQALHTLDGQSLVRSVSASDSRVTKYEHRLQEAFNFYRHEIAILCVLLLRGPQTPGELRVRAEREGPRDPRVVYATGCRLGGLVNTPEQPVLEDALLLRRPRLSKMREPQLGLRQQRHVQEMQHRRARQNYSVSEKEVPQNWNKRAQGSDRKVLGRTAKSSTTQAALNKRASRFEVAFVQN